MGRKPIGEKPLTDTEKKRRWRAKKGETLQAKYDSLLGKYEQRQRDFDSYKASQERVIKGMISAKYALIAERDAALRKLEIAERELRELKQAAVVVPFAKRRP
jgi:hypothetical protein